MNGDQFIEVIREHYEKRDKKFSEFYIQREGELREDSSADCVYTDFFKAWLILFLGTVSVPLEDGLKVDGSRYLGYHILQKSETNLGKPFDPGILKMMESFLEDEIIDIFGKDFFRRYTKMNLTFLHHE